MPEAELARIAGTLREIPFPKKFAVELCADCNLACAMCHHPWMRRPKGVMPFQLWKKCADEITECSPHTEIWFSFCGEPLLEPELLMRMLRYGRSIGLQSLNVNTNGMLLLPQIAGRLLETGVDLIVIGIDGFSSETYEKVRVRGLRSTVYSNVEYLLRERDRLAPPVDIQVQFIEMQENEGELEAFTEHWLRLGATVKVRKQLSWGGQLETALDVPTADRIPCPWALTMMHVFWDGRVPRCPGDTEGEEGSGNVWHHSLSQLWGRLGIYRRLHLMRRFDELPDRCQSCKDWMTGAAQRLRPTG